MRLIVATHNRKKINGAGTDSGPLGVEPVTGETIGLPLDEVEETGDTFEANAFLKADAACRQTGLPAVADDSGLMVDALDGRPGVYSARYAGEGASDADRIRKLLREMEGVPEAQRTARFVSAICCVFPDGEYRHRPGECPAESPGSPRGTAALVMIPCSWWRTGAATLNCPRRKRTPSATGAMPCVCLPGGWKPLYPKESPHKERKIHVLTSKQRAYLRSLANSETPILHTGKGGVSDAMRRQADDALTARELIKGRALENSPISAREAAEDLAASVGADVVQVVGRNFVLYRPNKKGTQNPPASIEQGRS